VNDTPAGTPPAGHVREPIGAGEIAPLEHTAWAVPRLPSVSSTSAPDTPPAVTDASIAGETQAPWTAAADAGVAIGRGSQKAGTAAADAGVSIGHSSTKAAVATAGFFSRLGRKVGGSF